MRITDPDDYYQQSSEYTEDKEKFLASEAWQCAECKEWFDSETDLDFDTCHECWKEKNR